MRCRNFQNGMPKDKSAPHRFFDRSRTSPYARSPKTTEQYGPKSSLQSVGGDEKEWEEVRCPICMEHPHNAVLLLCSSHERDVALTCATPASATRTVSTSSANHQPLPHHQQILLNKFLFTLPPITEELRNNNKTSSQEGFMGDNSNQSFRAHSVGAKLTGTCDFSGTYSELRKHARLEHPFVRPSEADSRRQSDWMSLEHERDVQDIIGASGLVSAEEWTMSLDGAIEELILGSSQLESADEWNDWMSLDEAIEALPNALQPEVEDQQYNTLHVEVEFNPSFSFLRYALNETSVSGSSEASDQSFNWRTTTMLTTGNPPSPSVNSLNETSVSGSSEARDQSRNWTTTARLRVGNPPIPRVDSLNATSVSGSSEASAQPHNERTTARMRVGALPRGPLASRNG
ncbi:unnamed protein product [Camellia sinensis]